MKGSEFTSSVRKRLWLYRILDAVCLFTPLIVYVGIALFNNGIRIQQKVAVISSLIIALLLTGINIISQKNLKCPIWIILIGLYVAIRDWLMPLIIILACTSVLDDLIFSPVISYYKTKLISSKTIDQRSHFEEKLREKLDDGEQQQQQ